MFVVMFSKKRNEYTKVGIVSEPISRNDFHSQEHRIAEIVRNWKPEIPYQLYPAAEEFYEDVDQLGQIPIFPGICVYLL